MNDDRAVVLACRTATRLEPLIAPRREDSFQASATGLGPNDDAVRTCVSGLDRRLARIVGLHTVPVPGRRPRSGAC
ncbi:hypothetical protein [Streptomyces sp. MMBL 11-1]|uniref:hypothetical protein n=1 Tax=Streptomyces sp. MMBL 11-1 TaxID=3026420 RepID=UPI002362C85D|nr:hypothetical protein [Streptomyces sp. MMBL 11-1]